MPTIDPKTPVIEIMKQYPETLEVFKTFGMRCTEDEAFANKSLEDNFIIEKINFIELLNALEKAINPINVNKDLPMGEVSLVNDNKKYLIIEDDIGEIQSHYSSLDDKFSWWVLLWLLIPYIGCAIVLCYILWYFLRPHFLCILGTNGFIISRISKKNKEISSSKSYLFQEMTDLLFSKTAKYINDTYSRTSFKFQFLKDGDDIFSMSGSYRENKKEMYGWKYSFLCGVEKSWTVYLLQQLSYKLRKKGAVHFETENEKIEIGNHYLKFKGVIFTRNEIKSYEFWNGMLFIDHLNFESKFFGFKTKGDRLIIPINSMYNQKAFLILLNNMLS